jgi:hypothetical protein
MDQRGVPRAWSSRPCLKCVYRARGRATQHFFNGRFACFEIVHAHCTLACGAVVCAVVVAAAERFLIGESYKVLELGGELMVVVELVQLRGAVFVHPQRHGGYSIVLGPFETERDV